jgi:hypothetical protein
MACPPDKVGIIGGEKLRRLGNADLLHGLQPNTSVAVA